MKFVVQTMEKASIEFKKDSALLTHLFVVHSTIGKEQINYEMFQISLRYLIEKTSIL